VDNPDIFGKIETSVREKLGLATPAKKDKNGNGKA